MQFRRWTAAIPRTIGWTRSARSGRRFRAPTISPKDGDGAIYVSAGKQVLRLAGAGYETRSVFAEFDGAAGGLAFHPDGRLLVCVAGRGLAAVDAGGRQTWLNQVENQPLQCLTSVVATADGNIFMTDGSSRNEREDWVRDLMEKNHLGRLIACGAGLDGAKCPVA